MALLVLHHNDYELYIRSSLKTDPAWPFHVKIAFTAVDFDQFSLYSTGTGTSLFSNDSMHCGPVLLMCTVWSARSHVCVNCRTLQLSGCKLFVATRKYVHFTSRTGRKIVVKTLKRKMCNKLMPSEAYSYRKSHVQTVQVGEVVVDGLTFFHCEGWKTAHRCLWSLQWMAILVSKHLKFPSMWTENNIYS